MNKNEILEQIADIEIIGEYDELGVGIAKKIDINPEKLAAFLERIMKDTKDDCMCDSCFNFRHPREH